MEQHRRNKNLSVSHNTVIAPVTAKNVIKVATKQHKDKQLYKRENIKETDVIDGGRSVRAWQGKLKYDKHLEKQKLEKMQKDSRESEAGRGTNEVEGVAEKVY